MTTTRVEQQPIGITDDLDAAFNGMLESDWDSPDSAREFLATLSAAHPDQCESDESLRALAKELIRERIDELRRQIFDLKETESRLRKLREVVR